MTGKKNKIEYLIDANVLIDYCENDISSLSLFSKEVGTVHIPTPIIQEEVSQLSIDRAIEHHFKLIEPEIEQVFEANLIEKKTSFYDNLCFILSQDNKFTCITNDKPLKRLCKKYNVPSIWGLEILAILAQEEKISKKKAVSTAIAIQKSNPFITHKIVEQFKNKIRN
ncbi:MAG: hypothetical protein ACUZ8O_11940 [Candidatus Anammoxibacter sp.]